MRQGGSVIRLFREKGFGFILGDDKRTRFVHARDVEDDFDLLEDKCRVTFVSKQLEASDRHNGLRAVEVRRAT